MKQKEILRFSILILTLFFFNILIIKAQTGVKYEDYENIAINNMSFFDDSIGGKYENVANPKPDAVNPSDRVGAVYLVENSPDYSQINRMERDSFYNFEAYPIFHFKIKNSNNILVKAEIFNTDKVSVWTLIYNTKQIQINNNTWQDIYFDFHEFADRKDINHIAISFAKTQDSKDTVFVDDIEFLNYNSVSINLVSAEFLNTNKILELSTNILVDETTVSLTDFTFSDPNIQTVNVSVNKNTIKLLLSGVTDNEFTVSYNKNTILGKNATALSQFSNFQIKNHAGLIYENFEGFSLIRFWNNWNEPLGCKTERNINNPQPSLINNTSKVTKIIEYKNSDPYASITGLLEEKIDLTTSSIFTCKFLTSKIVKVSLCLGNSDIPESWLYYKCLEINTTKANEWEDLVFNMESFKNTADIDQLVFSVNSGTSESEIEWYIDEIGGPQLKSNLPKLLSAEKIIPNNTIALQFDKFMSPTLYPNNFIVEIDGSQATIKEIYMKPENTNSILIVLDRAIQENEEVTLSYYKASDKNITSMAGGALESFSNKSVKNVDLHFQLYNNYEGTQYGTQFYFNSSANTLGWVVPNPSKSAINQSANVTIIEKPVGIEYSGTGILLDSKIDLVKNSTFMVNVYGKAGTTLRFRLINDDIVGDEKYTTYARDRFYTIKESDTWEEAVFNFYTDMNATEMNKINLELIGANTNQSIYIDNILGPKIPNPPSETEVPIYVNITTDQMGSETYWKITDADDETKVYAQNGPYINFPMQFKHTVYVPAETNLLFTIFDNAGNGIKSQVYGNGEYSFATSCGVIKTGGAFSDVEQTAFISPTAISSLSNYDKVIGTTGIANNEMANSIIQTCDGGYLMVGAKNKASKSDYDLVITHTNSAGEILWEKTIDTAKNEYASVIKELSDGSYFVIGRAEAVGADNNSWGFVVKVKLDGTIVFKVLLNASDVSASTSLYDAVVLIDGSILICGTKNDDIFLIKLAKNAVVLKTMEFPRPENQVATKISTLSDSTFLIGGYTSVDEFSPKQAFLSVVNKSLEEKSYTKIFNETTSSVESFSVYNDTICVVGQKAGKMFVALLNKELNILKEKSYSANFASSIVQLNDKKGFAVAGVDSKNIFLLKINNNGDSVWMSVFDKYEIASSKVSVSQTIDNGFVLAGTIKNTGNDIYLIKTNFNGCGNTPYQDQICAVTQSSTEKNLIAWERTQGKGTVSYNIFRESDFTGKYDKIGSVQFNALAGVYIDNGVDPDVQAYKYKISTVDKCGNESPMSAAHRTMHLSVSKSSQFDNAFELRWDHYEGADFGTYKFYKGSSNKDLKEFASIQYDPNIRAITDKNLLTNSKYTYRVSAEFTNECKSQLFKSDSGPFSQSLSNIAEAQLTTSTPNVIPGEFTLFPNPATTTVKVKFAAKGNHSVSITNVAGKQIGNDIEIINTDFIDIDVSTLEPGIYNITTWVDNKKICLQLLKKQK